MEHNSSKLMPQNFGGADYGVGYGKPPKATQFKPGRSGNPKGRPRGSKNKIPPIYEGRFQKIILEEFYRDIELREGGKTLTVPMVQAVARSVSVKALKGTHRAQRLFLELLSATENNRRAEHQEYFEVAATYKRKAIDELAWRTQMGRDTSDILPHPDDIHLNPRTGEVTLKGPMTQEEKAQLEELLMLKQRFMAERAQFIADLKDPEFAEHKGFLQREIKMDDGLIAKIDQILEIYGWQDKALKTKSAQPLK